MNKQEAIEKIKNIETLNIKDRMDDKGVDMVIKNQVLTLIEQIDEPQKVVVPEFIDSYIRYAKVEGMSLFIAMDNAQNKESEWIITSEETFARAWLDGYKVEQEKLYTVEIPNPNIIGNEHTVLMKSIFNQIVIRRVYGDNWKTDIGYRLTESEIKQDFDFLWQFAKPVEEVE